MTHERLNKLIADILSETGKTFAKKNEEYARQDALSNFKKAANAKNCTPEDALLGMVVKHWVSVVDLIQDIDQNKVAPLEMWQEKCGDIRVYMMLLEALVTERLDERGE